MLDNKLKLTIVYTESVQCTKDEWRMESITPQEAMSDGKN